MDINWRQEYEAAVIERNGLIMALTAAEERESAVVARAEAAEQRVAELEAQLAERDAEIAALTNYPNSEYGHVNY